MPYQQSKYISLELVELLPHRLQTVTTMIPPDALRAFSGVEGRLPKLQKELSTPIACSNLSSIVWS